MPKVAIIILDWNGWPDTEECLRSLQKLDYPDFEIILIDNGSKQRFPDIGSQFDDLRIIQVKNEKNLGFTGGNNQGIEMAMDREVDYVLLLNNDTVVESDFLSKMLAAGEADKRVGMIGPVIYDYNDRKKIQSARKSSEKDFKQISADNFVMIHGKFLVPISSFPTSNFFISHFSILNYFPDLLSSSGYPICAESVPSGKRQAV